MPKRRGSIQHVVTEGTRLYFTCGCSERHYLDVYAAAHYDVHLTHTCSTCEEEHDLFAGRVVVMTKGRV